MSFRRALVLMVAILLFATLLYLIGLNQISFWEDESWMAIAIQGDLPSVWTFAAERGVHPPLYFYIGWFYTRFTGDSELALRWLAGLCALPGIAWTYRLGASNYGRRAGVYAALLTAGSLFLLYFARLARHYTLFFTLSAALVYVYYRWHTVVSHQLSAHKSTTSFRLLPFSLAFGFAALLYTHYFGIWMALVLGLHAALTLPRRAWLRLWVALIVGGLLFIPWLPAVIAQFSGSSTSGGLGYVSRDIGLNLRAYLDRIFNGEYVLGFTLAALGLLAAYRWRRGRFTLLLILWLTLPLGLSLLFNTRFSWFIERNMIFTLPGVFVLLGAGLAWVSETAKGFGSEPSPPSPLSLIARGNRTNANLKSSYAAKTVFRWLAPVTALLFCVLGVVNYNIFWPFITPDWRSMANAVAVDARPTDTFVLNGELYSMSYYLRRDLGAPVQVRRLSDWLPAPTFSDRIWLMDANWDVQAEARAALSRDMQLTRRHVLGVLVAEFYQRIPESVVTTFGEQVVLGDNLPDAINVERGQPLWLDLWWRAAQQPNADYSVGVYLVDSDGVIRAQQDGGFDSGQVQALLLPADRWTPDSRALPIPAGLPSGEYTLTIAVYDWRTNARLLPENGLENRAFPLATVIIP
ncbi:MAG: glycosyltransferase family 39 protein [Anaerolineae bacterium]|nr:glycosyltransferase family 39 protein [Anaerolineae bacterium]